MAQNLTTSGHASIVFFFFFFEIKTFYVTTRWSSKWFVVRCIRLEANNTLAQGIWDKSLAISSSIEEMYGHFIKLECNIIDVFPPKENPPRRNYPSIRSALAFPYPPPKKKNIFWGLSDISQHCNNNFLASWNNFLRCTSYSSLRPFWGLHWFYFCWKKPLHFQ